MYGEALLYRSRAAFDELRQGIRDIEFLADPTAGELRIACPETLTAGFLPAIIDRLLRKYPRVVFHVVQTSAATRFRELRERNVDLTLARLSNPLTETDVDVQALFNDQVWVVAGARNPLTRRRKIIEFAELAREPWVAIPPDNEARSFVDEAFKASGLDLPKPAVVTFSQHVRFHLLATGRYLTALPGSVLRFNAGYFLLKRFRHDPRPDHGDLDDFSNGPRVGAARQDLELLLGHAVPCQTSCRIRLSRQY